MPSLTRNLFYGSDQSSFALDVEGEWPTDIDGYLFNIGPARRQPGKHWFTGQGSLLRAHCKPDNEGRIRVDFARVETPLDRIRSQLPELFQVRGVAEISPFGYSNFANTNVQFFGDRLFLGYDVGRPIEVDPESLEYLTPVGHNHEWLQTLPGSLEPMIAIGAHPGAAFDEEALYFANYELISLSSERSVRICRWDLNGAVEHWKLEGTAPFDSIHDVKVTRDYVVIADLPFNAGLGPEPEGPRRRVADFSQLWIISKADLRRCEPGSPVPYRHLQIPIMGGHILADYHHEGSEIVVYIEHHPMVDLGMGIERSDRIHGTNEPFHPDYEGLIPAAAQPTGIGRYVINAESGEVRSSQVVCEPGMFWGGLLFAQNSYDEASRNRVQNLWLTSLGFDPEMISERWWNTYSECHEQVFVSPRAFPGKAIPGAVTRFDASQMQFTDCYHYGDGAFPHPPTFVPRIGASHDADGYVLVSVHRDGDKAIDLFDAQKLSAGPIASASARGYNHPLLLHSTWAPRRAGPRPSSYCIETAADAWDTLSAFAEQPGGGPGIARALIG